MESVSESMTLSSANKRVFDVVTFGISLMNVRKRSGPRTVSCGTPERTSACDNWALSSRTCCCK